jgi:hypothetical protein
MWFITRSFVMPPFAGSSFVDSRFAASKARLRIVAACAVAALTVALATNVASAASSGKKDATIKAHHAHHAYVVHRWRYARPRPPYGYAKYPPGAIVEPGYVFLPGAGILDEACDLPTSACPNEYRDVQ